MVQIEGKYILEKNENFQEYLVQVVEIPEAIASMAEGYGRELTVSVDGKKITLNDGMKPSIIILDEEYDEPIDFKQIVLKSNAKMDGNKITVTSVGPDGTVGIRVHEFTETGYIITMSGKNVVAKRYFNRA